MKNENGQFPNKTHQRSFLRNDQNYQLNYHERSMSKSEREKDHKWKCFIDLIMFQRYSFSGELFMTKGQPYLSLCVDITLDGTMGRKSLNLVKQVCSFPSTLQDLDCHLCPIFVVMPT